MIKLTGNALLATTTQEYAAVHRMYGDGEERAVRSGVLKINHITEGLYILERLGEDLVTMRAWCLHPLLQMDDELIDALSPEQQEWAFDWQAVALAVEYRRCANAYLCRESTDNYSLTDLPDIPLSQVHNMLIADKIQNRKDFLTYHFKTHERSLQLDEYFTMWLRHLDVSETYYNTVRDEIDALYPTDTEYLLSNNNNAEHLQSSINQLK